MRHTRRDFLKMGLAGLPVAASLARGAERNSVIDGVHLGVQTYSFHEIPYDGTDHSADVIKDMTECGLYECELLGPQVEKYGMVAMMLAMRGYGAPNIPTANPTVNGQTKPAPGSKVPVGPAFTSMTVEEKKKARAEELNWRLHVPLDYFSGIRKHFNEAGINIFSYNFMYSSVDSTDEEIDRSFAMARALGAKAINVSTTMTMAKRLAPFAEKNKMMLGVHGHSETNDPEQISSRETFEKAFALSKYVGANLDIGHYTAAGGDPIEFIETFHERITNLHLKDRKKNSGANVEWGQGDTPIKEVLQLLKKKRYPIPAFIEYEYAGQNPEKEVAKCYEYCKRALASA